MSAQTIHDAFAPVEAMCRESVMRATWGHLAPEKGKAYKGRLVFTFGVYESGDLNPTILVCDFGEDGDELDGGPWFYRAVHDFLDRYTPGKAGCIYEWTGEVRNYKFKGKRARLLLDTNPRPA